MSATVTLADPGPLVINTDVDDAVIAALKLWLPGYLRITGQERGESLPMPVGASFNNPVDMSEWTDRALPGVMVATSKTQGAPMRHSDGSYAVGWQTVVSVVVRGTSGPTTRRRAALYEGAVRRVLGHRNVWADSIVHAGHWQAAEVRPVPSISRAGRYLAAGMSTFMIVTDRAFRDSAGLLVPEPPVDPANPTAPPVYVPIGTVTEIDLTVEDLTSGQAHPDSQQITSGG